MDRMVGGASVVLCALFLSACVSASEHEEMMRRAAAQLQLARAEVQRLETSARSLDDERAAALEELEDLRIAREALQAKLAELETARVELSAALRVREEELAKRNEEVARLRGTYDKLVGDLQTEVAAGRVEIEQLRDGLSVKLSQAILFASGSAELSEAGGKVIRKLAQRFVTLPHRVDVEGHSDNVALRPGARHRTNWELAAARAARVVQVLAGAGVPEARLRVISHAHTRPLVENTSAENRARNRRIEIRLREQAATAPAP